MSYVDSKGRIRQDGGPLTHKVKPTAPLPPGPSADPASVSRRCGRSSPRSTLVFYSSSPLSSTCFLCLVLVAFVPADSHLRAQPGQNHKLPPSTSLKARRNNQGGSSFGGGGGGGGGGGSGPGKPGGRGGMSDFGNGTSELTRAMGSGERELTMLAMNSCGRIAELLWGELLSPRDGGWGNDRPSTRFSTPVRSVVPILHCKPTRIFSRTRALGGTLTPPSLRNARSRQLLRATCTS